MKLAGTTYKKTWINASVFVLASIFSQATISCILTMDDNSSIREAINKIEELILSESERYERASTKKENLYNRLEILEKIRVLQAELKRLNDRLKS